jgi:hypothetical protein
MCRSHYQATSLCNRLELFRWSSWMLLLAYRTRYWIATHTPDDNYYNLKPWRLHGLQSVPWYTAFPRFQLCLLLEDVVRTHSFLKKLECWGRISCRGSSLKLLEEYFKLASASKNFKDHHCIVVLGNGYWLHVNCLPAKKCEYRNNNFANARCLRGSG